MFEDSFQFGHSPLDNDLHRQQLQEAILDGDAERFRQVLEEHFPLVANEQRLYGVLIMTDDGLSPILVDRMGERIGPDSLIVAHMPIDLLNVEYGEDEMIVTIGDQVWKAPIEDNWSPYDEDDEEE